MALGAREIFWQVAQKPGKPLYFASYQQQGNKHQSYLLGLPGNPAAVLIGLYIHVHSLLNCLQQQQQPLPQWQTGIVQQSLKTDSREQLLRMRVDSSTQGLLELTALKKQQSHMLSNMAKANALVRIPAAQQVQVGDAFHFLYI
jgi:molybdopterin molybdotransferase